MSHVLTRGNSRLSRVRTGLPQLPKPEGNQRVSRRRRFDSRTIPGLTAAANRGITMDKPDAEKTTITIKAVEVEAWEQAKQAANKRGETQGAWVSRACRHMANLERGDGVIQPGKPDNPAPVATPYAGEVAAFAALLTAMGVAGAKPNRTAVGKANRLLNLIGATLPPTRRLPGLTVFGQSLPAGKP